MLTSTTTSAATSATIIRVKRRCTMATSQAEARDATLLVGEQAGGLGRTRGGPRALAAPVAPSEIVGQTAVSGAKQSEGDRADGAARTLHRRGREPRRRRDRRARLPRRRHRLLH